MVSFFTTFFSPIFLNLHLAVRVYPSFTYFWRNSGQGVIVLVEENSLSRFGGEHVEG